ncbi:centrosomal protein of 192 kDa isoform X2 [Ambystoma mexicanum]|uniref:centrosomal protein of 192 kDa isoform X2 n=1 Tax=Ambystoma mexicanum TaxID=8296 RepID=UPI0037E7F9BD
MAEHFRNIEDETLPSFCMDSLMSDSSRILDNVSLSSNLGLPVAASTVARSRAGFDRNPEVQASYLEDDRTSPSSGLDPNNVLQCVPKEKCALSFKDGLEDVGFRIPDVPLNTYLEAHVTSTVSNGYSDNGSRPCHSPDSSFGILPLEQMEDLSVGLCTLPLLKKEKKTANAPQCKLLSDEARRAACDNSASLSSFLENEKLLTIEDFDCSTDDDVEDEELYGHHLEPYFERLVQTGMHREAIEEHMLKEPSRVSLLRDHSLNQDNCQMTHPRMGATGMDSSPPSHGTDKGYKLEDSLRHIWTKGSRPAVEEDYRNRFRPGLEGGSSDEDLHFREAAEGEVITASQVVNCDLGGDGSSGSGDEAQPSVVRSFFHNTHDFWSSGSEHVLREVAGEEHEDSIQPVKEGICENIGDSCGENDEQKLTNHDDHGELGLSDAYLSPTSGRRAVEYEITSEKLQKQYSDWTVQQADGGTDVNSSHSVVYQNEKGKWVTDLAYYTPFKKEQGLNITTAVDQNLSDDNFIPASSAIKMIEDDQKEFEKEHRFMQEEVMDIAEATLGLGDTSWRMNSNNPYLRASHVSHELEGDARYRRLSLGEFFGLRSEALGCLGGDFDGKRPSFGYYIRSPEKQDPVALLRSSCASRGFTEHEEINFYDDTLTGDVEELKNEQPRFGFTTFTVGEMDHAAEGKPIPSPRNRSCKSYKEPHSSDNLVKDNEPLLRASDSLLSISTIASAIANASTSADPSQLAAMIMALSNKDRNLPFTPFPKTDGALNSPLRYSSFNTDGISIIDIEKYLKKSDPSAYESIVSNIENESYLSNLSQDMRLCKLHEKNPCSDVFTSTVKMEKADSSSLSDLNESPIGKMKIMPMLEKRVEQQKKTITFLEDASDSESGECPLVKSKTIVPNVGVENRSTAKSTGIIRKLQTNHSATKDEQVFQMKPQAKPLGTDEKPTVGVSAINEDGPSSPYHFNNSFLMASSKSCSSNPSTDIEAMNLQSLACNIEQTSPERNRAAGFGALKSASKTVVYNSFSNTVMKSTPLLTECKKLPEPVKSLQKISDAGKEKHVNFQHVLCAQNDDMKSKVPQSDVNYPEDEQYSFRPSTSPLIHSSPSQDSITPILSGSGDSPTCTATSFARVPSVDNVSPASSWSSPSMSRLTYVSTLDGTLQNTMSNHTPDASTSNNTFQLSTTIIRASPTPSEEYAAKGVSENSSCQHNEDRPSLNTCSRKTRTKPEGLQSKNINSKNEICKGSSRVDKDELESDSRSTASVEKQIDCGNSAVPSKAGLPYSSKSAHISEPITKPELTNVPITPLLAHVPVLPPAGIHTTLKQHLLDNPCVPISNFKSAGVYSDGYPVPSGISALLPGHSFSTTQLAQQFVGSEPSTIKYTVGSSTVYGPTSRFLDPASQAGYAENYIQNCNVGPGLINSLPLASGGFQNWDMRRSSGFEHVKVPDEIRFPNACCVGIASQTSLSVFNPTGGWMYVSIATLSVSVNGEKVDTSASQCLVFEKNKAIGPRAASDIKILFVPLYSGIFQCVLSVSSWPANSNENPLLHSEALASKVVLTALAENPSIEVDIGKTNCLDFGDLPSGSWKALPLKLINKTRVTVPIRLLISANAVAWPCFAFSKEPVNLTMLKQQADRNIHLAFSSVLSHVMHASYNGEDAVVLVLWVLFRAPQAKQDISNQKTSSESPLADVEEFFARVDVELESAGPSCVMKSIPLRARTGTARIHAPQDLQTVHLCAQVGSTAKQFLPLKNAGNISVELSIKCAEQDSCFSVEPVDLFLMPGTEQAVAVLFCPQNPNTKAKSSLIIYVQPSGPQYEVMLEGWVENTSSRTSLAPSSSSYSTHTPPILSNKQFVTWGGVALGRAIQQKLILRNNSSSLTQNLRLLIKGQDQDCFQLHSTYGPEERLTHNREVSIQPGGDREIGLMFTPSRVSCMFAKLEIKHSGIRPSQPGVKFTIPLSGYGGTSNIILENVRKLSDSYVTVLKGISDGKTSRVTFCLRNTGSRAAYVKAVCFMDIQTRKIMDPSVMSIFPEKLVLLERTQEVLTVTCNSSQREQNLCDTSTALLGTICFLCGDEVSRQQYRRAVLHKPEATKKALPDSSLLKNLTFDEEFQNEKLVKEVYELPQRLNDIQLFYGTMQRVLLSVVGSATGTYTNECTLSSPESLDSNSGATNTERNIANVSLDVLPVKGPQGPQLSITAGEQVQNTVDSEQIWTIQPENLILNVRSISGTDETGHLKLFNYSRRTLKFELSWPAHCLTITPQHGVVEQQSNIHIFVSPNPSLAAKSSVLPWSGQIYVLCDNGQKFVKVRIRESADSTATDSATDQLSSLSSQIKTPVVHTAKPFSKTPMEHIEAKEKTIIFPKTASGNSSETYIDIRNTTNEDVRWHLSSSGPPCVKGVDASGETFRANYTAFRCSHVSGMLEAGESMKVPVTFIPRDTGDYTQFWELESHPLTESHTKHNLRFHLRGKGVKADNELERASSECLVKTEALIKPRRRSSSDASALKTGKDEVLRGVFAPLDLYTFPPTRVGQCSTLKVNFQNKDLTAHMLTFVCPKLPFWLKHSKLCLRPHHYINVPVKFKPKSSGRFEGAIVAHTEKSSSFRIQLIGEALNT